MAKIYVQNAKWGNTTLFRQTEHFSGKFKGHFFSPFRLSKYDWAILDGPPDDTAKSIPRARRIHFLMENPIIWRPHPGFFETVGVVVSPFDLGFPSHIHWIQQHPSIPWFYGIPFRTDAGMLHINSKSHVCLDKLLNKNVPKKNKTMSIIASSKSATSGHQWRFNVLQEVKKYFGCNVDIYGFGHRPISNKETAIDRYFFSICIENTSSEYYWSEKLSDVTLGYTTPIYSGASKVQESFSDELNTVDFHVDPKKFCNLVSKFIDKGPDNLKVLNRRRHESLCIHNIFAVVDNIIKYSG